MESEEGNKSYTYMYALINLCEQDSLMCFDVLSEGTNKMKYNYVSSSIHLFICTDIRISIMKNSNSRFYRRLPTYVYNISRPFFNKGQP